MSVVRTPMLMAVLAAAAFSQPRAEPSDQAGGLFGPAIEYARPRVVKIYGAGIGREAAYGTGVLISSDGKIVTALTLMLTGRNIRVVTDDGRRYAAEVVERDDVRRLALLKIESEHLPHFELSEAAVRDLQPGDWLITATNSFKVAEGAEPVSFNTGVFAGRTTLEAWNRTREFAYDGPVLLTDIIVTTPGAAGGALLDARGRLVGVIGRRVQSKRTNTWVNYALPGDEVAAFLRGERREPASPQATTDPAQDNQARITPEQLGIRLFDIGGRVKPAFIERVQRDSPAALAGLRANDLILQVDGAAVERCEEVRAALGRQQPGAAVQLVVKRGDELLELTVTLPEAVQ